MRKALVVRCVLVLLSACSGTGEGGGSADVADVSGLEAGIDGVGLDERQVPDVVGEADVSADIAETVGEGTRSRLYTFKAMGGVSMGACGFTFHARHPGHVDVVAALGGYINYHYLQDFFLRMMFGGWCEMDDILAHVDDLNNPDLPDLQCGPVQPRNPWEFAVDFNHWHADDSGGMFDRDFFWQALEGMFMAFGNLAYFNPEHPYLPPGVPVDWVALGDGAEKCANTFSVGKPLNYNVEYNPDGEYDLITFCDGEEPVPVDKDHPDYWKHKGTYEPEYPHDRPVAALLAVDYNGNGMRDFHEPVVVNAFERYDDTGSDGCPDADEDGAGGCGGAGTGADPNGDNYDMLANPTGTEDNGLWEAGEDYIDAGLDGVQGTGDYGEEDGEYSMNPHLKNLLETSVPTWIDNAPLDDLLALDVLMDGGIRDNIHALVSTFPLATRLQARIPNTRIYDGFTENDNSLHPVGEETILLFDMKKVDWTAAGIGKNLIVRYGNPDATPEQIKKGDGKHVGTDTDIINRLALMMLPPAFRWPDMDVTECQNHSGQIRSTSFYSTALKNRYEYSVSLPPCYDAEEYAEATYPVIIYLPGHGITAADAIAGGVAFNILMQSGVMPKFIFAAPEGYGCRIDTETGTRYCTCRENEEDGSLKDCLDPDCKGPEEECAVIQIPSHRLKQEVNGGHFFANHVSNRFGDTSYVDEMKFEDLLLDFLDELDANFKTRPPALHEVPDDSGLAQ